MIWFEYTYVTPNEIFKNIKLLTEYSIFEYIVLTVSILLIVIIIYYVFPALSIYFKFKEKEKDKFNKKKLIKQIAMQKDINDEIEKELNIW